MGGKLSSENADVYCHVIKRDAASSQDINTFLLFWLPRTANFLGKQVVNTFFFSTNFKCIHIAVDINVPNV